MTDHHDGDPNCGTCGGTGWYEAVQYMFTHQNVSYIRCGCVERMKAEAGLLPEYDPIDTVMRQWWCSLCKERGPQYNAGDPYVHAGWAVHVAKHERENRGTE